MYIPCVISDVTLSTVLIPIRVLSHYVISENTMSLVRTVLQEFYGTSQSLSH